MRFAFLRKVTTSTAIVALIAACGAATGEDLVMPEPDGGLVSNDGSVTQDDAMIGHDGAIVPDAGADSGPVCKMGCTSDFECHMTCPPPPANGVNCCDIASGICYAAATRMCGMPMGDASID